MDFSPGSALAIGSMLLLILAPAAIALFMGQRDSKLPGRTVLRPRPYYDARKVALETELPNQAAQPRRELPQPSPEDFELARQAHAEYRARRECA